MGRDCLKDLAGLYQDLRQGEVNERGIHQGRGRWSVTVAYGGGRGVSEGFSRAVGRLTAGKSAHVWKE